MSSATSVTPIRLVLEPLARESDVQRVIALEAASYPADEAASERSIRYRLQHADAFFVAAFAAGAACDASASDSTVSAHQLVGFVNGTLTSSRELEDASMHEHDPVGTTLCIHSVVMDPAYRRQGLAAAMLKQYVQDIVEQQRQVMRIVLLAKAHLVAFYVQCGFAVTRLSPVVHGKDTRFEFVFDCVAARQLSVVQVDAFTSDIFGGNPAAVVVMPRLQFHQTNVAQWMQCVAMENNLTMTAFVTRRVSSSNVATTSDIVDFDLRWFTPTVEATMCGHATLSTAFVLFEDGHVSPTATIHFHTQSGVLVCRLDTAASGAKRISMELPLGTLVAVDAALTTELFARCFGIDATHIIALRLTEQPDVLVHVTSEAFAVLTPDFQKLAAIDARGVVVTAEPADKTTGFDFQSRYFGPRVGINEDPVTGSAHCALAAYWSAVLSKTQLTARQACPHRGGFVTLELPADRPNVVLIKGHAVTALRGTLLTVP